MNITTSKAVAILRDTKKLAEIGVKSVSEHTSSFYSFIADRLANSEELLPEGYFLAIELATGDAKSGVDGFTGTKLRGKFVGLPPMMFAVMTLPLFKEQVIAALFDEEFAKGVVAFREQVNKEVGA